MTRFLSGCGLLLDGLALLLALMMIPVMIGILLVDMLITKWRGTDVGWRFAVVGIAVAILLLSIVNSNGALAAQQDRYAGSPLKQWFDSLASKRGPCCSDADGFALSDVDWEATRDGKYRVRLDGAWHDVPDDALITVPNRAGRTMVWPIQYPDRIHIRCFMPGPMT